MTKKEKNKIEFEISDITSELCRIGGRVNYLVRRYQYLIDLLKEEEG